MSDFKYIVYKVSNLKNSKIYIGITSQTLNNRRKQHYNWSRLNDTYKKNYFSRALCKYKPEDFIWEEIAFTNSWKAAGEIERSLIAEFNTTDRACGYNITAGGEGTLGYKHSEEVRRKISASNIARNRVHKRIGYNKGIKFSKEICAKLSLLRRGKPRPNARISSICCYRATEANKKPVIAVDLFSGLPRYFSSIKQASEELKISTHTIYTSLLDKHKPKRYGFVEDFEKAV